MEKNYKKEYYYDNNTVLTAVDNGHAVLVIYIENLNNKSDGYCVPIAYLSNNCGLFFMDKDCYIVNKYISWCECMKYEITIDSHLLYMHWPREISKIGWDVYGAREESFKEKAAKLIAEAKDIIANARDEREVVKPELRNLLKDKKSEDLKTHLDKAQKVQVNVGSILSKMDKFSKEYQLEGAILTNFKDANNELKTTHNDQSTFISNLQKYNDILDIKEPINSEEVIFDRSENKELEGHSQILPDHEEL